MCNKRNSKTVYILNKKPFRVDGCIKNLIEVLNDLNDSGIGFETLSCCCGHGRYNMSIVVYDKYNKNTFDLISGRDIPRKKRFYIKDKEGYYYIPEIIKMRKGDRENDTKK